MGKATEHKFKCPVTFINRQTRLISMQTERRLGYTGEKPRPRLTEGSSMSSLCCSAEPCPVSIQTNRKGGLLASAPLASEAMQGGTLRVGVWYKDSEKQGAGRGVNEWPWNKAKKKNKIQPKSHTSCKN